MEHITSRQNALMTHIRKLNASRAYRRASGEYLCDGVKLLEEALRWNAPLKTVVLSEGVDAPSLPSGVRAVRVPADVMRSISPMETPQGTLFTVRLPDTALPETLSGAHYLVLDGVQDPGNVGTILRTLDAAGFDGCILTPGCADPFAPKTMRATMGSLFRVPMTFVEDGAEAARWLRTNGWAVIGAELRGQPFYQRGTRPDKLCVLIGNEGAGLTEEILAQCSFRYKLPMRGGAESLNAGIAAAVMMYDLMNR